MPRSAGNEKERRELDPAVRTRSQAEGRFGPSSHEPGSDSGTRTGGHDAATDRLRTGRGFVLGLGIALALWLAIAVAVWLRLR
jgi:hypothetical protein